MAGQLLLPAPLQDVKEGSSLAALVQTNSFLLRQNRSLQLFHLSLPWLSALQLQFPLLFSAFLLIPLHVFHLYFLWQYLMSSVGLILKYHKVLASCYEVPLRSWFKRSFEAHVVVCFSLFAFQCYLANSSDHQPKKAPNKNCWGLGCFFFVSFFFWKLVGIDDFWPQKVCIFPSSMSVAVLWRSCHNCQFIVQNSLYCQSSFTSHQLNKKVFT